MKYIIKDRYTGAFNRQRDLYNKSKNTILQLLAKRDTRTVAVVVDDDDVVVVVCDGASVSGLVTELLYELYTYHNGLCLVTAESLHQMYSVFVFVFISHILYICSCHLIPYGLTVSQKFI